MNITVTVLFHSHSRFLFNRLKLEISCKLHQFTSEKKKSFQFLFNWSGWSINVIQKLCINCILYCYLLLCPGVDTSLATFMGAMYVACPMPWEKNRRNRKKHRKIIKNYFCKWLRGKLQRLTNSSHKNIFLAGEAEKKEAKNDRKNMYWLAGWSPCPLRKKNATASVIDTFRWHIVCARTCRFLRNIYSYLLRCLCICVYVGAAALPCLYQNISH